MFVAPRNRSTCRRLANALLVALATLTTAAAAGCGGGGTKQPSAPTTTRPKIPTPPPRSSPEPTATPVSTTAPLPQPSKRCGTPNARAQTLRFRTTDGAVLDGAIVGKGQIGAVLIHEYPGPMCGWWAYANYLAHHGVRALLFDLRCVGLSTCTSSGSGHPTQDVAAAIAALRNHGAKSVAVIGASMGGAIAVVAAAKLHPDALVNLSGELDLPANHANAGAAAKHVTAPALFVVARRDRYTSVEDMRTVASRARSHTKRLIILPAGAGHGWDMLWARRARGRP